MLQLIKAFNVEHNLRCLIGSGVGSCTVEVPWGPWKPYEGPGTTIFFLTCVRVHLWCFHAKWEETIWVSLKGKNHLKLAVETLNWAHTGPGIMPVSTSKNRKPHYSQTPGRVLRRTSQVVGKINPIQILFWYCPANLGSQKIKLNEITWLYIIKYL